MKKSILQVINQKDYNFEDHCSTNVQPLPVNVAVFGFDSHLRRVDIFIFVAWAYTQERR